LAVRRPLLTALAAFLLLAGNAPASPGESCLNCHPRHYRELGSCVGCHGGDPRSERLRIAHHDLVAGRFSWHGITGSLPVLRGNKLLEGFACRRCHTTAGKGNRLASNLDRLPAGTTPADLFRSINSPALMMPGFRLEEGAATDLVNAILAGAGQSGRKGRETPQVVHFESAKAGSGNIFEKKCGGCHKMLTAAVGALGKGEIGPNLSGLLSEFYPATAAGKKRWSAGSLEKWLDNPRQSRPLTQMRPVQLQKEERARLLVLLADAPAVPVR